VSDQIKFHPINWNSNTKR